MRWLLALYAACCSTTIALAGVPTDSRTGQYLCVSERSAGFKFDARADSWASTNFRTEAKYLVAPSKNAQYAFQITKVGENIPTASCEDGFNEPGYLLCTGIGGEFKFNRDNGRFLLVYAIGYFNVLPKLNQITDEKSDTPFLEIGKCSPF